MEKDEIKKCFLKFSKQIHFINHHILEKDTKIAYKQFPKETSLKEIQKYIKTEVNLIK